MATVFVKPAEGARIRQPERNGAVMPDSGALVARDSYYERLLLTGDVVETVLAEAAAPADDAAPKLASGPPPDTDTRR